MLKISGFYGVSGPSAATDFILAMLRNRGFYVVLGSREGKKSEKKCVLKVFQHSWPKKTAKIMLDPD